MRALQRWLLTLTLLLVASSAHAYGGGHWSGWAHRPWTPRDLGLTVWLTAGADYNATTGDWIDRSTNGNNGSAVNATIPSAGTAINSRATVHFTTLGGVLTGSLSLSTYTVLAVEKTSNAGYVWVHGTDGAVNGAHQYTGTTETNYFARSSVVSHKRFVAGLNDGVARSLVTTFGGTTADKSLSVVPASDAVFTVSGSTLTVTAADGGFATESTLSTLNGKVPSKGTAIMTGSTPVTIATDDTMTKKLTQPGTTAAITKSDSTSASNIVCFGP